MRHQQSGRCDAFLKCRGRSLLNWGHDEDALCSKASLSCGLVVEDAQPVLENCVKFQSIYSKSEEYCHPMNNSLSEFCTRKRSLWYAALSIWYAYEIIHWQEKEPLVESSIYQFISFSTFVRWPLQDIYNLLTQKNLQL